MDLFQIHIMHYLDQGLDVNEFLAHKGVGGVFWPQEANFDFSSVWSTLFSFQWIFFKFTPNIQWTID